MGLGGGGVHDAPLGEIPVAAPSPPPPCPDVPACGERGLIAVCLATYEPDPVLLERPPASLRAQTDRRWICLVSADGSSAEGLAPPGAARRSAPSASSPRGSSGAASFRSAPTASRPRPARGRLFDARYPDLEAGGFEQEALRRWRATGRGRL